MIMQKYLHYWKKSIVNQKRGEISFNERWTGERNKHTFQYSILLATNYSFYERIQTIKVLGGKV